MNPTIETSVAERKATAVAQHDRLTAELGQLQRRRQEAEANINHLHLQIAVQERSGDAEVLAELRAERRHAAEVSQDLARTIATVERELAVAKAEVEAATIAVLAQQYNDMTSKQCALSTTITEAIETLTEALRLKVELAGRQDRLLATVCPYPYLTPAGIRSAIAGEIQVRLGDVGTKTPLKGLDWSCRRMAPGGNLEE